MSKLIITVFMIVCFKNAYQLEQKLNVHVLYESLCPDSIKFIKEQLYPAWNDLSNYINLKFVPFGKSASLENGSKFICQHGPKECMGNRVQSCVLHALQDQNAQMEYVHCFMNLYKKNQKDEQEFGQSCATSVGVNWEYVKDCYDSSLGTSLQLDAEVITSQIAPKFVPTILYNGQFHQKAQDDSQVNFRGVVCNFITQVYPGACKSPTILQI